MTEASLVDRYSRKTTSLRISLTERCNFRCLYCMPPEGISVLPDSYYLTAPEVERFSRLAVSEGIQRIRLTGGEPLLRPDIIDIVSRLSSLSGLKDLALTTNGSRLAKLAIDLKSAGLKRINISLDSLNAETFARITHGGRLDEVMRGIERALEVGFPVKLNAVLMKGINDHEVEDFVEFALKTPVDEIRFIEFMPLCGTGWKPDLVFSLQAMPERLSRRYQVLPTAEDHEQVANSYVLERDGLATKIGFINTLSEPFCGQCSRIRLSADGQIRPCLFAHSGVPVRHLLRAGAEDVEISAAIRQAVHNKPKGNDYADAQTSGHSLSGSLGLLAAHSNANPNIRAIGG